MPKDPFAKLDKDFQDAVAAMSEDEIRATVSKVSLNQVSLMEAKELDQDLAQKRDAASVAGAVYREGTAMNKLRIAFCRRVLGDKGKENGSFDQEEAQEAADDAADRAEDGET